MDCGSGLDFVLPHLSGADREGLNKAIDGLATLPMKVCSGLVHGDVRSHVILSPGVVGATGSHTCECLTILVNTAFEEQQRLPPRLTLQFDGASTNKCILVLACLGLYVLEGVFSQARARCELENHAHDVYDSFHAVHARRVKQSTFYHLDELRGIIRAAHEVTRDKHVHRPVVGHDVLVSNLWEVRDLWEWLAPGYGDPNSREDALANAAFTSYIGIQAYRDFKMELEEGSAEETPKVGLWAKTYMTSAEYTYLGTLLTKNSFRAVTQGKLPAVQARNVSDQKIKRETDVAKKLRAAVGGKFGEQFSAPRLADAIAMCTRHWAHFDESAGHLSPGKRLLPHELAAELRQKGLRTSSSMRSLPSMSSPGASAEVSAAAALLDADVNASPHVEQREHAGAETYGFRRGAQVPSVLLVSRRAPTDDAFRARLITPRSFVITRPAVSSSWGEP